MQAELVKCISKFASLFFFFFFSPALWTKCFPKLASIGYINTYFRMFLKHMCKINKKSIWFDFPSLMSLLWNKKKMIFLVFTSGLKAGWTLEGAPHYPACPGTTKMSEFTTWIQKKHPRKFLYNIGSGHPSPNNPIVLPDYLKVYA